MDEIKGILKETIQSILPVVGLVIVIELILFDNPLNNVLQFVVGAVMVTAGLGLFLIGVKVGLLRIGEILGSELSQRVSFPILLATVIFFGFAVTAAEPNVSVLAQQLGTVAGDVIRKNTLVIFLGISMGLFMAIAVVRMLLGVPMKYLLAVCYAALFVFSYFLPPSFVPLAFDAGGVTTGPLVIPVFMSLGVGLTSVISGKGSLGDSFGFVALAALAPVVAVMLLGVIYV